MSRTRPCPVSIADSSVGCSECLFILQLLPTNHTLTCILLSSAALFALDRLPRKLLARIFHGIASSQARLDLIHCLAS